MVGPTQTRPQGLGRGIPLYVSDRDPQEEFGFSPRSLFPPEQSEVAAAALFCFFRHITSGGCVALLTLLLDDTLEGIIINEA